jgi:hypothetical protein
MRRLMMSLLAGGIAYGVWMSLAPSASISLGDTRSAASSTLLTQEIRTKPIVVLVGTESDLRQVDREGKISPWQKGATSSARDTVIEGRDFKTGERAYFSMAEGKILFPTHEFFAPNGKHWASVGPPRDDGTATITLRESSSTRSIVVRESAGRAIREGRLIGWWNADTLALAGRVSSTPALYAVPLTGAAQFVASLPPIAERIRVIYGNAWYLTALPGEGLEAEFQPPSELHRVNIKGKDDILIQMRDGVMTDYEIGKEGDIFYQRTDGTLYRQKEGDESASHFGNGALLGMTICDDLLIRQGMSLSLRQKTSMTERSLGEIGSDQKEAFLFPWMTQTCN